MPGALSYGRGEKRDRRRLDAEGQRGEAGAAAAVSTMTTSGEVVVESEVIVEEMMRDAFTRYFLPRGTVASNPKAACLALSKSIGLSLSLTDEIACERRRASGAIKRDGFFILTVPTEKMEKAIRSEGKWILSGEKRSVVMPSGDAATSIDVQEAAGESRY
uniref:Uncharacterized protein n=1 Tax=Pristionchus pacificus TaxID=54126 RepID=A0A2A6CYE6_PRIPA|eukprot:PDM83195.1 hypothetical protein PRIPAC_37588 [Pristionchus pacificus]